MFPLSHMLKSFVKVGSLKVIAADGSEHRFGGARSGPSVTMQLTDPTLYRKLFLNPELHAGEAYMDGRLSFPGSSLRDFLTLFSVNRLSLGSYPLQTALRYVSRGLRRFQQANRIGQAQRNVAHHYDLGNAFYRLFLDDGLFYSCAYFRDDRESLEAAQVNKCRLLASKLDLRPGQRVLDIGCGWGGLAIYLARVADVRVVGVTLSEEQHALARERVASAGLSARVRIELKDYRQLEERFDRIVSVGMFEHVGVQHYGEFFAKINRLLADDGVMVLHSIGHMSPPGTASPWLRKYIFPGAYSPALSEVFTAVERNSLWVCDLEFLRLHYATTLSHWESRFQANRAKVAAMYDERFCRMWEFYLISAEMMFRTGSQLVFHMQLAKQRDAVPIVRDYVVDAQRALVQLEQKRPGEPSHAFALLCARFAAFLARRSRLADWRCRAWIFLRRELVIFGMGPRGCCVAGGGWTTPSGAARRALEAPVQRLARAPGIADASPSFPATGPAMLKLYFSPSTSSLATHIALIECGAAFELAPRLLSKQQTRTPEYLAINPDGKVPALVIEGGRVLTEVAATLYYISRKYPAAGLWPEGDLEAEAEAISWMSFVASTMHGSRAKGPEHVAGAFAVANRRLGDRQWAIGRYSVADIHLFRVYWRFRPGLDAKPGTFPALEAHHERMLARPAVQKALAVEKTYE